MRLSAILAVVCACAVAADVTHIKASKARLLAKLSGRGRHHKRGVLASVPTFKLGHDIPYVTHSVLKPLVVTYPPTAVPLSVKVPITNPVRYPVGHRAPFPHSHVGAKLPHFHKTFLLDNPGQHFHHHHHHVAPKPAMPVVPSPIPVPATPIVPVAQPSIPIPQPVPSPPVFINPITPTAPLPVPAPVPSVPVHHVHVRPVLPAAPVTVQPAAPLVPFAPQYVLRPGNAVQTSIFATYPKYPLVNYPTPLVPFAPAPVDQVYLDRPQYPHYHFLQPQPTVSVHAADVAQPHIHPTHTPVSLDNHGWSPLPAAPQPNLIPVPHSHDVPHFTQEQSSQVFEQHVGDYHDQVHHQLQELDHVHHQIQELEQNHFDHQIHNLEQAQYEQQFHNQQHASQDYGAPQQTSHEYSQPNEDYSHLQQEYGAPEHQLQQEYGVPHQQLQQEYGASQQQLQQEYGAPQQQLQQEYGAPQHQLSQDYGPPRAGLEGRSYPEEEPQEQAYHNHIPLGLQPPIDRPLEHFR